MAVYPVNQSALAMTSVDFNADGRLDLVLTNDASSQMTLLNGDGKGGFSTGAVEQLEPGAGAPAVIDFDSDGLPDIALPSSSTRSIQVYLNNGKGGFKQPALRVTLPEPKFGPASAGDLDVADFDGDGRPDLLFPYDSDIAIVRNAGAGGYRALAKAPGELSLSVLGVGDFTGDGVADLVASPGPGPGTVLRIYAADGKGGFGPPKNFNLNGQITSRARIFDLNGDGKLDVVLGITPIGVPGGGTGSAIAVFPGDGAGGLGAQSTIPINGLAANQLRNLIVGDFDGDTRPDIGFSTAGKIFIALNTGAGALGAPAAIDASSDRGGPLAGDFNGDSKSDLVSGGGGPYSLTTRINRCGAQGLFISGRVVDSYTLQGVGAVAVSLSGAQTAATQTDYGGNYQFTGLSAGGNYTVAAQGAGYSVDPASRNIFNLGLDQTAYFNAFRLATNVSAAGYTGALAPDSIAAAFGVALGRSTTAATGTPLPFNLNDTRVDVIDSLGAMRPAPLFFVSPNQVNYLVPPETVPGAATVRIRFDSSATESSVSAQTVDVAPVAPGLFSADASGRGLAAALILRVKVDGSQSYEPVANFDQGQMKFVSRPIDLGPQTDQVFLILFGTGLRNRTSLSNVSSTAGGLASDVLFAGPQSDFVGLDQVNVKLPRALAGRGEIEVNLTADGKAANPVRINVK
jgi:uncharacterized protein (TIGR03437 family)